MELLELKKRERNNKLEITLYEEMEGSQCQGERIEWWLPKMCCHVWDCQGILFTTSLKTFLRWQWLAFHPSKMIQTFFFSATFANPIVVYTFCYRLNIQPWHPVCVCLWCLKYFLFWLSVSVLQKLAQQRCDVLAEVLKQCLDDERLLLESCISSDVMTFSYY